MRKVTFGGAVSLDNFFAGPNGEMDWLLWCDEAAAVMNAYWPKIDTLLMGRKTWEVAMQNAPPQEDAAEDESGIKTYVFSRTLDRADVKGAVLVSENAGEIVKKLKQKEGKEICLMGGGDLARSLFEAGVIDEIGLNVHPVMLGSGVPIFHPMKRRIGLELLESTPFENGCVYSLYRVIY